VRIVPSSSTRPTPARTRPAASLCPMWSRSIAPERISPIGLAIPRPAMSGAAPCAA
jgi:hypothetical protein